MIKKNSKIKVKLADAKKNGKTPIKKNVQDKKVREKSSRGKKKEDKKNNSSSSKNNIKKSERVTKKKTSKKSPSKKGLDLPIRKKPLLREYKVKRFVSDEVLKYRSRVIDDEKREFLEKIIKHYETESLKCPNEKNSEKLADAHMKFQRFNRIKCCKNHKDYKGVETHNPICQRCFLEIPVSGKCDC